MDINSLKRKPMNRSSSIKPAKKPTRKAEPRLEEVRNHKPGTHPSVDPRFKCKFDLERVQIIIGALASGNYRNVACQLAGISYQTFSHWMSRGENGEPGYREFYEEVLKAEAACEADILEKVRVQVPADWRAGMEILKRRHPDRWGDRKEVTGKGGGPVTIQVVYEDEEPAASPEEDPE